MTASNNRDELSHAGITAKERLERIENMLVSIDEKLDNKASRAEVAALELRLRHVEVEGSKAAQDAIAKASRLATERSHDLEQLESRMAEFCKEIDLVRNEHNELSRRVAYAFGGVAAIVTAFGLFSRFISI